MSVSATQTPAAPDLRRAQVDQLLQEAAALDSRVQHTFGPLTTDQLNWKPDPGEWSVGQCLDHLIVTSKAYFSTFEAVVQGTKGGNFWERLPVLPNLFGSWFYKAVHPATARPLPAPQTFRPTNSAVEPQICAQFSTQQQELIGYMQRSRDLPLDTIIMSSPIAVFVVYSVGDAYRILVAHQHLHIQQAERLLKLAAFPQG